MYTKTLMNILIRHSRDVVVPPLTCYSSINSITSLVLQAILGKEEMTPPSVESSVEDSILSSGQILLKLEITCQ